MEVEQCGKADLIEMSMAYQKNIPAASLFRPDFPTFAAPNLSRLIIGDRQISRLTAGSIGKNDF